MAGFQPPRSARRMVRFVQIHRAMPSRAPAARSRPVLVVAPSSAERAELFGALEARSDFRVLYAASVDEAVQALRDRSIALLIASSELPAKVRLRPALPMLVIRNRQAEEPVGWERSGVGVLRRPLLPEALDRSVDVVLGLGGE
jgi:hypothetical protein